MCLANSIVLFFVKNKKRKKLLKSDRLSCDISLGGESVASDRAYFFEGLVGPGGGGSGGGGGAASSAPGSRRGSLLSGVFVSVTTNHALWRNLQFWEDMMFGEG